MAPGRDAVREGVRISGDPRAVRTRQAIVEAVEALIAEGAASAPSVSEVVRRAGISRSSFYAQFADINEVSIAVFSSVLDDISDLDQLLRDGGAVSEWEAARLATERLVEHVAAHRGFYRIGLPGTLAAYDQAILTVADHLAATPCLVGAPGAGITVEAASRYLAAGTLVTLRAWVSGEVEASGEEITAQLMAMTPAWMTGGPSPEESRDGTGEQVGRTDTASSPSSN